MRESTLADINTWIKCNIFSVAPDQCLPWPFYTRSGEGKIPSIGKGRAADVIMAIAGKPRPVEGMIAGPTCGHDRCVNPHHLVWKGPINQV